MTRKNRKNKYENEDNKAAAGSPVYRRTYLKGVGVASALSGLAFSGASPVSASTVGYGDGGYGEMGYGGVGDGSDGGEPAELTVLVEDDGDALEGADVTIYDDGEAVKTARTDADGEATLELEAGVYELQASKDGYGVHAEEVEVTEGGTASIVVTLESEPAELDLWVFDEDDEPIEGADVTIYDDGSAVVDGTTDAEGCFAVELEEGTYEARVSANGYESYTEEGIAMVRDEPTVVSVVLEEATSEPAELEVCVTDGDGDVRDAIVEVEDADGEPVVDGETDAEGCVTFELDPAEYGVVVTHADYDDTASETVDLDEGEGTTITVTLAADDAVLSVDTAPASDVSDTEATLRGELSALEGIDEATVYFEYRRIGRSYWESTGSTTRTSEGDVEEAVSGLSTGTQYEFRAVAESADGDLRETGETESFATERSRARPGIDRWNVGTTDTRNPHAYIDVEWEVSHRDGLLNTVVIEVEAVDGSASETMRASVSGETASGGSTIRVLHGENATYEVALTAVDTNDERTAVSTTTDA